MKLIKPNYEIITDLSKEKGELILKEIERASRTCYKSEERIDYSEEEYGKEIYDLDWDIRGYHIKIAKSARKLIPKLIKNGHHTMLEFGGTITVKFICDRGVTHELVRHRLASFAQESTRYCNYGKDEHIQFIIPCWTTLKEGIYTYNDDYDKKPIGFYLDENYVEYEDSCFLNTCANIEFLECLYKCEQSYNYLIEKGWSPQQARAVLPNSVKTEINVSANIRQWRNILQLRTEQSAHPQIREIMTPLLNDFKKSIPILFDDI
jgi:thymidylate synthase (FAD)